eukprot:scaffold82147_cov42-Prasinocladus_malaysianus.AAC.1
MKPLRALFGERGSRVSESEAYVCCSPPSILRRMPPPGPRHTTSALPHDPAAPRSMCHAGAQRSAWA